MSPESAQKRPLKDLTASEYHSLFTVAYGYGPGVDKLIIRKMADSFPDQPDATFPVMIGDGCFFLSLYGDGQMVAHRHQQGSVYNDFCAGVNMRNLIAQIDALNVQFGPRLNDSEVVSPSTQTEL